MLNSQIFGVTANLLSGGLDEVFTRTDASGPLSFLRDALGSTLELTDATGAVQQQYVYDPFGVTSTTGNATANSYEYTGRETDSTGLYYLRARYYNPATGRFLSEDPIGLAGGVNEYAYAYDNPIDLTDPLGLKPPPDPFAPNNGTQNPRSTMCKVKVGAGIALDTAGTVAGLIPGAGAALVTTQVSLGLASSAYSAFNGNVGFTIGNATGAQLSAVRAGAVYAGMKTTASVLPVIGTIYNGAVLGWDVWHANSDYQVCMAGN